MKGWLTSKNVRYLLVCDPSLYFIYTVNGKIEATQRQLLSEKDSTESLHGQLVVKTQFLVDCKVKCQLAQAKVKTLEEQKDCLETKNKELKQKLVTFCYNVFSFLIVLLG